MVMRRITACIIEVPLLLVNVVINRFTVHRESHWSELTRLVILPNVFARAVGRPYMYGTNFRLLRSAVWPAIAKRQTHYETMISQIFKCIGSKADHPVVTVTLCRPSYSTLLKTVPIVRCAVHQQAVCLRRGRQLQSDWPWRHRWSLICFGRRDLTARRADRVCGQCDLDSADTDDARASSRQQQPSARHSCCSWPTFRL